MSIALKLTGKTTLINLMRDRLGRMPLFFLTLKNPDGTFSSQIGLGDHDCSEASPIRKHINFIHKQILPNETEFETPTQLSQSIDVKEIAEPKSLESYFKEIKSEYKFREYAVVDHFYEILNDYYLAIPYLNEKGEVIGCFFPILKAEEIHKIDILFIKKILMI